MKKRIVAIFLILILLLSGYAMMNRPYNNHMTEKQVKASGKQMMAFVSSLDESISELMDFFAKHVDEIGSSKSIDLLQYQDFLEIRSKVEKNCVEIFKCNDSKYSAELQLCIFEMKNMSYAMLDYFSEIDSEKSAVEIALLTNQFYSRVMCGLRKAKAYVTEADIAMNAGDYSGDKIEKLKSDAALEAPANMAFPANSDEFANKFGTVKTKCDYPKCDNLIASAGDTNCCVMHSGECVNCGKYINAEETFCKDCVKGVSSSKFVDGNCEYAYLDGSTCGRPTDSDTTLCDKHFELLLDFCMNGKADDAQMPFLVSKETKKMGAKEFDKLLAVLPLKVEYEEYVFGDEDEEYENDESPDWDKMTAVIKNNTKSEIKRAAIAFAIWDDERRPIEIFENGHSCISYFDDLNLAPGDTISCYAEIDSYSYEINKIHAEIESIMEDTDLYEIDKIEAVVVGFETPDGDKWTNPYFDEWSTMYDGKKYSEKKTVEVGIEDAGFTPSPKKYN